MTYVRIQEIQHSLNATIASIAYKATKWLRSFNAIRHTPWGILSVVTLAYLALALILVVYEALTGATRGFGAWFLVLSILIGANCGPLYGLYGVLLYVGLMDALFLGQPGAFDVPAAWLFGAPLPAMLGVLAAPLIVRAWRHACVPTDNPPTPVGLEALQGGAGDAQDLIRDIQQGRPERLAWHVQCRHRQTWTAYDVGFYRELAAHIDGAPVHTHEEWLAAVAVTGDDDAENARPLVEVDQA